MCCQFSYLIQGSIVWQLWSTGWKNPNREKNGLFDFHKIFLARIFTQGNSWDVLPNPAKKSVPCKTFCSINNKSCKNKRIVLCALWKSNGLPPKSAWCVLTNKGIGSSISLYLVTSAWVGVSSQKKWVKIFLFVCTHLCWWRILIGNAGLSSIDFDCRKFKLNTPALYLLLCCLMDLIGQNRTSAELWKCLVWWKLEWLMQELN